MEVAKRLAEELKEISVAEFFEKNRHLLGYPNPARALLTVVKEAVDNALDASQEAGILPEVKVRVKELGEGKFKVIVEDNGPGVLPQRVPDTFAKFLVGTKFYKLAQSRGIFGLGIHGSILYAQLTSGKPAKVISSMGKEAHAYELFIDVVHNRPQVASHQVLPNSKGWHGVRIELELEGAYTTGWHSIPEYLKQTAMVNPYATILYDGPDGKLAFERKTERMPKIPKRMKPHPHGVEIGTLRRMLSQTKAKSLLRFMMAEFCRVGKQNAMRVCKLAKLDPNAYPSSLDYQAIKRLHTAIQRVDFKAPPTDCLTPLGEELLLEGLRSEIKADFYACVSRKPAVYRGFPFAVEVGIAYGGELNANAPCRLYRFANLVPLLYDQGGCALTKAVKEVDWKRYGLSQPSDSLPVGPLALLIHLASVWIPFISEGKQAIAEYPEIVKEVKLALQEVGRKLASFVRQKRKEHERRLRVSMFERYAPEIAASLQTLTQESKEKILNLIKQLIGKHEAS